MKNILVTGCAGFIGGNFVKLFKSKFPKCKIIGIDDLSTGKLEALDKNIIFYNNSISDKKVLENIFSKHKPEFVFHFAANPQIQVCDENASSTSEGNILGTIALLEMSKKHKTKRLIYSSSASVYGTSGNVPTKEKENAPNPQSIYAIQKLSGEFFCKLFSDKFGLDTVSLRYFNVYGPGQYGNSAYSTVISAWLEALYFPKNKKAFIEGNGSQTRDFCYVEDIAFANIKAMESTKMLKGTTLNIGSGQEVKIIEINKLIEKYTGQKLNFEKRPARLLDIKRSCANIERSKKVIGYQPKTDIKKGIQETIKWFEKRAK